MKLELIKSFGTMTFESEDPKAIIKESSFFAELPDVCPVCGLGLYLHYHKATKANKSYDYYELHCQGRPQHRSTFGQHADGGTLFYKSKDWETWYANESNGGDAVHTSEQPNRAEPAPAQSAPDSENPDIQKAYAAFKALGHKPPVRKARETDALYIARLRSEYGWLTKEKEAAA